MEKGMTKTKYLLSIAVSVAMALLVVGCGSSSSEKGAEESTSKATSGENAASEGGSSGSEKGSILIGISAGKTGPIAPYDLQSGEAFQMRIKQIDEEGGVNGRQLTTKWLNSKSDNTTAAANTKLLLEEGAKFMIGSCDFDFGSPTVITSVEAKVPAMYLCASGFKAADPAAVTQLGGSMGLGSDTEGAAMAEWVHEKHPEWSSVYIEKDTSLEYSIDTAVYFKKRFEELGGKICGEETFVGSSSLDLQPQITKLSSAIGKCSAIYDGSWQPYGSQLIREVRAAGINKPIISNASVQGTTVDEVAGKNVSNFYALGFACDPTFCHGEIQPEIKKINEDFKAEFKEEVANPYAYPGYYLANVVAEAFKKAGTTEGAAVAKALFGLKFSFAEHPMEMSEGCHRPHPAVYSVQEWTNGEAKQIGYQTVKFVPVLPSGKDACAGKQ